jgi:hypothetical protein
MPYLFLQIIIVQLATVIPMSLKGKLEKVQILDQTPHSLFWNFDALGYISMGLATLLAVPVFAKNGYQMGSACFPGEWIGYTPHCIRVLLPSLF